MREGCVSWWLVGPAPGLKKREYQRKEKERVKERREKKKIEKTTRQDKTRQERKKEETKIDGWKKERTTEREGDVKMCILLFTET